MGEADLRKMRFAYSPLTEAAQSLYVLHGAVVPAVYESWFESIRDRAAVLVSLKLPKTTTDLARELGHSPATISEHLATLRRCGLLMYWRVGRRVLYVQTPLGASIAATGSHRR
jgi:DNA-binding transcriptional ArsR family regulator